jgi:hypothetical protein
MHTWGIPRGGGPAIRLFVLRWLAFMAAVALLGGVFDWKINLTATIGGTAALSFTLLISAATPESAAGVLAPDAPGHLAEETLDSPFVRFHALRVMLRQVDQNTAIQTRLNNLLAEIVADRQRRSPRRGSLLAADAELGDETGGDGSTLHALTRALDRLDEGE